MVGQLTCRWKVLGKTSSDMWQPVGGMCVVIERGRGAALEKLVNGTSRAVQLLKWLLTNVERLRTTVTMTRATT